jgi:proline iminopeptidase
MPPAYPAVEPYDSGLLDVGDGQQIYWECCGNPDGQPAVFVHGGPGSGAGTGPRRYFDPAAYRIVLFDQRGCGRSRPLASEPDADLSSNTTAHLIADLELLREQLHIDSWTMLGVSWGTTLGLAYSQRHPQRVNALVLAAVGTTSRREVQWITEDVGRIFPREWELFAAAVPTSLRELPLVQAYSRLLFDPDPQVRDRAASNWCRWEDAHVSMTPGYRSDPRFENREFRLVFARLVTRYWSNAAFLPDGQLLREAAILNGIPGALIHGRFDVSGPLETAWKLAQVWTSCALRVVEDAGHGGGSFGAAMVQAVNEFRNH